MKSCFRIALFTCCMMPSFAAARHLGELVPENACFYMRWDGGSEGKATSRYIEGLGKALSGSGIVSEFSRLMGEKFKAEDRDRFNLEAAYWQTILGEVPWANLFQRESMFAMRLSLTGRFEIVCGFDAGDAGKRDRALLKLRQILRGLCGAVPAYEMLESDREGVPTTVVYSLADPADQVCVGGEGSTVVVTTSALLLRESLELLTGESSRSSFLASSDYQKLRANLDGELSQAALSPEDGSFELLYLPRETFKQIGSLDVVNSYHLVAKLGQAKIDWQLRYDMRSDNRDNVLSYAFESQESSRDILQWIPRNAIGFTASSGARADLTYDFALDLVQFLSGGPILPELLRRQQSEARIDVRDDLLRHLTGRRAQFRLPKSSDGKSGFSVASVFEIADDSTSIKTVSAQIAKLANWVKGLGVPVQPVELDGIDGEFFAIDSASLFGWYVYLGVSKRRVVIATTEDAFRRGLNSSEKSILDNDRFTSLWSPPKGDLEMVSFGNIADELSSAGDVLRTVGVLSRLLPSDGELGLLKPLLVILPRFQSSLRALDFLGVRVGHVIRTEDVYRGFGSVYLRRLRDL